MELPEEVCSLARIPSSFIINNLLNVDWQLSAEDGKFNAPIPPSYTQVQLLFQHIQKVYFSLGLSLQKFS